MLAQHLQRWANIRWMFLVFRAYTGSHCHSHNIHVMLAHCLQRWANIRWTSRVFMPCRVSFPERLRDVGPLSSPLGQHHVDVPCFQCLHAITLSFPEHPAFSFRWTSGVFMPYRVSFPEPPPDGGPSSSTLGQHQVEVPCFQGIHAVTHCYSCHLL